MRRVELLELGGRAVVEGGVQTGVVEPADVFDDGQLERVRVRQTRSQISSVLNELTKLSASALSSASPAVPTDASAPASSRVCV